jgi:hypothetical protein
VEQEDRRIGRIAGDGDVELDPGGKCDPLEFEIWHRPLPFALRLSKPVLSFAEGGCSSFPS